MKNMISGSWFSFAADFGFMTIKWEHLELS